MMRVRAEATAGRSRPPAPSQPVEVGLRRFTWPYQALMAICSDLDETPDRHVYLEIARFLNTTRTTRMGPGAGLEVGNSIYFHMPPGQYAYWNTDDAGRALARDLIRSGHLDVLHSFGDLAGHRDRIQRDLDELRLHGLRLRVWVDHSKAPSNFGPDIMRGIGDVPGSPSYHADLTVAYGIRYVWRGRTTAVLGQDVPVRPRDLAALLTPRHAWASTGTAIKEAVKRRLGRRAHPRWQMHWANRVCRPSQLRDGQAIWEFLRSNPSWAGPGRLDTADGVPEVITARMVDRLAARGGVCILYTHLGKVIDPLRPFGPAAQRSFRLLAHAQQAGRVLVRSTRRLLCYLTARDHLHFQAERLSDLTRISLSEIADPVTGPRLPAPDELQGLTFEMPRCGRVEIVDPQGSPLRCEVIHLGDKTLATLPWRELEFPENNW